MTININFVKSKDESVEEAFNKVKSKFDNPRLAEDVTQLWDASNESIETFASNYFSDDVSSTGVYYVKTPTMNTKQHPYIWQPVKNKGPRSANKAFIFKDKETNTELGRLSTTLEKTPFVEKDGTEGLLISKRFPTMVEAREFAKSLMYDSETKEVKFKGTIVVEIIKELENGVIGELSYSAGKTEQDSGYYFFSLKNE